MILCARKFIIYIQGRKKVDKYLDKWRACSKTKQSMSNGLVIASLVYGKLKLTTDNQAKGKIFFGNLALDKMGRWPNTM